VGSELAVIALTRLKKAFKVPIMPLEEGAVANITLFDPMKEWIFTEKEIISTSKNAALLNCKLKGKAYGIYANKQLILAS
jgi:dihydroorotase